MASPSMMRSASDRERGWEERERVEEGGRREGGRERERERE